MSTPTFSGVTHDESAPKQHLHLWAISRSRHITVQASTLYTISYMVYISVKNCFRFSMMNNSSILQFFILKRNLVTINVQQRNYGGRTAENRIKRVENWFFGENFEKLFKSIQKSHFVRKIPKNSSFSLKHIPQHPNRPLEPRKFPHLNSPVPTVCMLVTDLRSFFVVNSRIYTAWWHLK